MPSAARGQSVELYASAGPTISDAGHSVAAGIAVSPASRLTFVFNVERTHLSTQTNREGDFSWAFRGGTLLLGTAELRVVPFGRGRVGPYAVAGAGVGVSRPNVNELFPDPVSNQVRVLFAGGGIQAPLRDRLTVFADARMTLGLEGTEGIMGIVPSARGSPGAFDGLAPACLCPGPPCPNAPA